MAFSWASEDMFLTVDTKQLYSTMTSLQQPTNQRKRLSRIPKPGRQSIPLSPYQISYSSLPLSHLTHPLSSPFKNHHRPPTLTQDTKD